MKSGMKKNGDQIKEKKNESLNGGDAVFLGQEYLFDNTEKGKLQKLKSVIKS